MKIETTKAITGEASASFDFEIAPDFDAGHAIVAVRRPDIWKFTSIMGIGELRKIRDALTMTIDELQRSEP